MSIHHLARLGATQYTTTGALSESASMTALHIIGAIVIGSVAYKIGERQTKHAFTRDFDKRMRRFDSEESDAVANKDERTALYMRGRSHGLEDAILMLKGIVR